MKRLSILGLLLIIFAFIPNVTGAVISEEIYYADSWSSITAGWDHIDNALYSENHNASTGAGKAGAEFELYDYNGSLGFTENDTILEVWLGFEGSTNAEAEEKIWLSAYNGSDWSIDVLITDFSTETLTWYNFTEIVGIVGGVGLLTWDYDAVNGIKTRTEFFTSDLGGCFTDLSYFISWNQTSFLENKQPYLMKRIDKAEKGDLILCSNKEEGIHFERITELITHNGEWEIIDIYSGLVEIPYIHNEKERVYEWMHHNQLTEDHMIEVLRDGAFIKVKAGELELTDLTQHIDHSEVNFTSPDQFIPVIDHYVSLEPIQRIDRFSMNGSVYDIKLDGKIKSYMFQTTITDLEFSKLNYLVDNYGVILEAYIDPIRSGKTTYLCDSVPIKIKWSSPEAPTEAVIAPLFVGLLFLGFCFVMVILYRRRKEN